MHLPLSWLKQWLSFDLSPEKLAHHLTMLGLEVEGIEYSGVSFKGVFVADVLSCTPHPKADKLQIATVKLNEETYTVVCGGANCRPGLKVAYAAPGAVLKGEKGDSFTIEARDLRGVPSHGMLCGHDELDLPLVPHGIEGGIMELDDSFEHGAPLASFYGSPILEVALTPNLVYCNSIRGVAKELACSLNLKITPPTFLFTEGEVPTQDRVKLKVEAKEQAPRFALRLIEGVKVGPSPKWLVERLEECGVRSVNNIVDITNYVLKELGQPLHAFDFSTFPDGEVIVRVANEGEELTLLDETILSLKKEHLVVASKNGPSALAGVMGGSCSEVNEKSKTILLEAAFFDPVTIRKSARSANLSTDASYQFERGTDPELIEQALERAAALIQEIAGGTCLKGTVEYYPTPLKKDPLLLRTTRINALLGTELSVHEVETFLKALELPYKKEGSEDFKVTPPFGRHDLNIEIDIIEEIARFYGFENLQSETGPALYQTTQLEDSPTFAFEEKLRGYLLAEGLDEWLTCDLVGEKEISLISKENLGGAEFVPILNPRSKEQAFLRTSLLPSFLQVIRHHQDHQVFNSRGFEIGRTHLKVDNSYQEPQVISLILSGNQAPLDWQSKESTVTFYTLKGIIERMLQQSAVPGEIKKSAHTLFHPGRQATLWIGQEEVGTFGELHPQTTAYYGIETPILFAEFALAPLHSAEKTKRVFKPQALYPSSSRDWTVTQPKTFESGYLLNKERVKGEPLLKQILLIDVYQHEKLGSEFKNVTYRFVYRSDERTLSVEEVEQTHQRIVSLLTREITS